VSSAGFQTFAYVVALQRCGLSSRQEQVHAARISGYILPGQLDSHRRPGLQVRGQLEGDRLRQRHAAHLPALGKGEDLTASQQLDLPTHM